MESLKIKHLLSLVAMTMSIVVMACSNEVPQNGVDENLCRNWELVGYCNGKTFYSIEYTDAPPIFTFNKNGKVYGRYVNEYWGEYYCSDSHELQLNFSNTKLGYIDEHYEFFDENIRKAKRYEIIKDSELYIYYSDLAYFKFITHN